MASKKQIEANRANARNSRGPRSAHGKRRASQNSFRYGLTIPNTDPAYLKRLEKLARRIAGIGASPVVLELARTAARAEVDISSIACLKVALIERVKVTGALLPPKFFRSLMHDVRWIQQMFRWSIGSRRTKPRDPVDINALPPMPVEEPARSAEACRRVLTELLRLARYEDRATSRRDRAIRQTVKAKTTRQANKPSRTSQVEDLQTANPLAEKHFTIHVKVVKIILSTIGENAIILAKRIQFFLSIAIVY
jgi:hypothetical protein